MPNHITVSQTNPCNRGCIVNDLPLKGGGCPKKVTASGSPPTDTVSSAWAAFARFHAHQIERGKKRPARSNKLSR